MANIQAFPGAEWDDALLRQDGHILQSSAWLRVQRALGHAVRWSQGDGWQWGGAVRAGVFPRYLYLPYGPSGGGATRMALEDAIRAAGSEGVDFVRVEPTGRDARDALRALDALAVKAVQPRCTWVLDLSVSEEELRRGLESGHRSRINAAERRGITIRSTREPGQVAIFVALQRAAAERNAFTGQSEAYHHTVADVLMPRGVARLYVAEASGTPVAASIAFDFGATRYYAHSASHPLLGRQLGAGPPLLWRMILDARERGATTFDFWGVLCSDRPGHPWSGFSRFKRAFGGRLVERAGTWEMPLHRLRHRAFTLLRRVR
ncbi:MAG TPA: peptidoglycan bridge formation glycyltransferase FemA/FemB family protein [Candidatus Dormibacteraeota bacterium]